MLNAGSSFINNDAVVLYQAADGTTSLEVRLHEKTAWLTQASCFSGISLSSRGMSAMFSRRGSYPERALCKKCIMLFR